MQDDTRSIIVILQSKSRGWVIDIDFIIIFVILNKKMNIMCYCILNYNYSIIFVMFYIKMARIIVFYHTFWINDFLVFSVTIFWGSQRITLTLIFDFNQQNQPSFAICLSSGMKNTCQCLSEIKVKLNSSIMFPKKHSIFHHIVNNSAQG